MKGVGPMRPMSSLAALMGMAAALGSGMNMPALARGTGSGQRRVSAESKAARSMVNGQHRVPQSWKCQASGKFKRRHA
jgi:hypothetical protein